MQTSEKFGAGHVAEAEASHGRPRKFAGLWRAVPAVMGIMLAHVGPAQAQDSSGYPNRPISLVVPLDAGALMDNFARTLAHGLSERLGQPVVVINRPGASEAIGVDGVARAAPDGYTLLVSTQTGVVLDMAMRRDLAYDSRRDLTPVSLLFSSPLWLVANPHVPVTSVSDLVSLAKSEPGKLSYASIGTGSTLHLAGELFDMKTGVNLLHVPYKGMGGALLDLLSGRVDLMFSGSGAAIPQIRSGKLRALATTGPKRSFVLPNVPTMIEAGVPGYSVTTWLGLFGPKGLPKPVVERLNKEIAIVLASDAIKARAVQDSLDVESSTPEQLGERIRSEIPYWTQLVEKLQLH
jgi:tripartite-type tricarboxylate transporter receptor subunit TctC